MSETNITRTARQTDGTYMQVMPDGTLRPLVDTTDWARVDAMTDDEVMVAALADPDAQPLTPERAANMKRMPQTKIIRRILALSQDEFASRYRIPVGTLRDWEQGRFEPDAATRAYLTVIAREPEMVARALEVRGPSAPMQPGPSGN